jgi:hypothetical protein
VSEVLAQPFVREAIGRRGEQRHFEVTADAIRKYAAATDDTTPAAREGRIAPPVYAIVPVWETIAPASRAVASDKARRRVVHYEQDMLLHAPIEAGMTLVSDAAAIALLPRPNGTSLVIHTRTTTPEGALVNEQYVTEFFRGVEATDGLGERAPDHRLPDDVTSTAPRAEIRYEVADDQPARYAEASGDFFEIHLDDAAARAVGLPGRIVHGLCTWPSRAGPCWRPQASTIPARSRASPSASPRRFSPATASRPGSGSWRTASSASRRLTGRGGP